MKLVKSIFSLTLVLLMLTVCVLADESVLVENGHLSIVLKSMETTNDGLALKVRLENKSDKTIMFSVEDAVINGWVTDPFWASEVPAGKKSNETIEWRKLSEKGVTSPASDVRILFKAYDSNDWMADPYLKEEVELFPNGKENAHIDSYSVAETDKILKKDSQITFISRGFGTNWMGSFTAYVYIKNDTDKKLMFSADDVSVNGFVADPYWATDIGPHSQKMNEISWSKSTFEENDIETVETIEMRLRAYDSEDWMADNVMNEMFELTP